MSSCRRFVQRYETEKDWEEYEPDSPKDMLATLDSYLGSERRQLLAGSREGILRVQEKLEINKSVVNFVYPRVFQLISLIFGKYHS